MRTNAIAITITAADLSVAALIVSIAALLVAILALLPEVRLWWRDEHADWPYLATARWLASPVTGANLRIALIITNLSRRTGRFQVWVKPSEGEDPEAPLTVQPLDGGEPFEATAHIRVGPRDRERCKITLAHSGEMGEDANVLLQEGQHSDKWIPVGPAFRPLRGPKAWVARCRIRRRNRLRPIEDFSGWGP